MKKWLLVIVLISIAVAVTVVCLFRTCNKSEIDTLREVAEQGWAKAQFKLGVCYANGDGVTKDPAEAVKWLRLAAKKGNEQAQFVLSVMGKSW